MQEAVHTVYKVKYGKAACSSEIIAELLKSSCDIGERTVTDAIENVKESTVLDDWVKNFTLKCLQREG